jgi:hypothetical protein
MAVMAVSLGVAILSLAGCVSGPQHSHEAADLLAGHPVTGFVGDSACEKCHSSEFDLYHATRHFHTMRHADAASLGDLAPPPGRIPDSEYALRIEGGKLRFERSDSPQMGAEIGYALGSGKAALTFVGEFKPHQLTEFRMTYEPPLRRWCLTPGQEEMNNLDLGTHHPLGVAVKCMGCHSVKTVEGSTEPAPGFLGVGCESCHGPGAEHIQAAQAKQPDLKMPDLSKMSPHEVNSVCSKCHRSIDDITLAGIDATSTARFQGYALEMSPCFKKSGGALSCVTCHDPHRDVETQQSYYEKVCLSCHAAPGKYAAKPCPVNAKSGCIPCHMPQRRAFLDSGKPFTMADHLILARSPIK